MIHIVLIMKGKGNNDVDSADRISVKVFDHKEDAVNYVHYHHNMKTKHWTNCQIVKDGEEVETYFEELEY